MSLIESVLENGKRTFTSIKALVGKIPAKKLCWAFKQVQGTLKKNEEGQNILRVQPFSQMRFCLVGQTNK